MRFFCVLASLLACSPSTSGPRGRDAGNRVDAGGGMDAGPVDAAVPERDGDLPDVAIPTPDVGVDSATCGTTPLPVSFRSPRVLVLFDRSCSMRRLVDGGDSSGEDDPNSRYQTARRAIERQVGRYGDRVHWGIMLIPELELDCDGVPTIRVLPAAGRQDRIRNVFANPRVNPERLCANGRQPRVTPTLQTLESAASITDWRADGHDHVALVVTDGASGCGSTVGRLESATQALRDLGVRTAIVGFGPEVTGDSARGKLDAIALAGGLSSSAASPHYYIADDEASLDSALDRILREAVSCRFDLETPPPAEDRVFVFVNDEEAVRDDANGWRFNEGSVELVGSSCERLQRGEITRVNVVFGCPELVCEPQPETCNGLDEDCDDRIDEGCLL
ncbi:MAG: hypothetical protein AAGE52_25890 [Myxococcota bacterium]